MRPTDLLDIYRRFLKLEEHRLKLEHQRGGSGRELCQRRADMISVMLRHIWESAWETHRKSHLEHPPRIALLAVGGFGRGELNPYSDIDILFLHPHDHAKYTTQVNDIVQHVLYVLWDIGFQVGHATRTLGELVNQANADLRTKTSLLEARLSLRGRAALLRVREGLHAIAACAGTRRNSSNGAWPTRPNAMPRRATRSFSRNPTSKPVAAACAITRTCSGSDGCKRGFRNMQDFVEAGMLTPSERKQLDRAYDRLLRIRTELHYQQKRAGDILTLRLQGQIADSFGYQHRTILRRIEAFMREYYYHASLLYNLGNMLGRRLCGGNRAPRPSRAGPSCLSPPRIARRLTASSWKTGNWRRPRPVRLRTNRCASCASSCWRSSTTPSSARS